MNLEEATILALQGKLVENKNLSSNIDGNIVSVYDIDDELNRLTVRYGVFNGVYERPNDKVYVIRDIVEDATHKKYIIKLKDNKLFKTYRFITVDNMICYLKELIF